MNQTCQLCGAAFITKRASKTHCSDRCRFLTKIDRTSETRCWIWTGGQDNHGYGKLEVAGRTVKAHRWAYENLGGIPLAAGLVIDHLCRNRLCVNPDHMEQVTIGENVLRGNSPTAIIYRARRATGETRPGSAGVERIVSRITAKGRAWVEANR